MKDHQTETIDHLRRMIKETQDKLESRTRMLVSIFPHILESATSGEDIDFYITHEWYERYSVDAKKFKDEYVKETKLQQNKDSKL